MEQGQAVEQGQPMEVDHDDLSAIVEASISRVNHLVHNRWGTSVDLYKFHTSINQTGWRRGHIFHGSNREDLSFKVGIADDIKPGGVNNSREALFKVEEPNQMEHVEHAMGINSTLNHIGILKPYVAGFNTQISRVICGFGVTNSTLDAWLEKKKPPTKKTSIPVEVQQLIRIVYRAIEKIWSAGCTSDELANSGSYYMIDDRIKINPLRIRRRLEAENDMMPLRRAFGEMIYNVIYSKWEDDELLDFIDILGCPAAGDDDVLGHPLLLSPHRWQLMYHKFDTEGLNGVRRDWLQANAAPRADWKDFASDRDQTLEKILAYQARQLMGDEANVYDDAWLARNGTGFETDFFGALHFSSVVTAHYGQHFKSSAQGGNWREEIKCRVDLQLKTVLPRLLTKRYNVMFLS